MGNIGRKVCHIWHGALAGIVQYIMDSEGRNLNIAGKELEWVSEGRKGVGL